MPTSTPFPVTATHSIAAAATVAAASAIESSTPTTISVGNCCQRDAVGSSVYGTVVVVGRRRRRRGRRRQQQQQEKQINSSTNEDNNNNNDSNNNKYNRYRRNSNNRHWPTTVSVKRGGGRFVAGIYSSLWMIICVSTILLLAVIGGDYQQVHAANLKVAADAQQPGEETFQSLQTVSTCSRYDDVRLHCDTPQRIVVHEARFSSRLPLPELERRCNHTDPGTYVKVLNGRHGYNCSEDIRSSINQRCSGQHACLFSWTRDHVRDPEARARCKGEGIIDVAYRCVDFASNPLQITSVCSRRLGAEQSYGYLMSPGFPQFYVPPHQSRRCNWTIQGRLGQTVTVKVLDVRLRPTPKRMSTGLTHGRNSMNNNKNVYPNSIQRANHAASTTATNSEECGDLLRLTSADYGGSLLADICVERQRYFLNSFSSANAVSVQFITSAFAPHRGFILEYKISGCPTLPAPSDGFLESRNETAATYRCRRDFYFADTLSAHKTLLCLNAIRWSNGPLGECLSTYELAYRGHPLSGLGRPVGGGDGFSDSPGGVGSNSIDDGFASSEDLPLAITAQQGNRAGRGGFKRSSAFSWLSLTSLSRTMSEYADFIVPSIIVCLLLIGNAIIVLYIYKLKRQNKQRVCARSPVELPLEDCEGQKVAPLATI